MTACIAQDFRLWLQINNFEKIYPINGYDVYQSGMLCIGVDFSQNEYFILTHEDAGNGNIRVLQIVDKFMDAADLIEKIKPYLYFREL